MGLDPAAAESRFLAAARAVCSAGSAGSATELLAAEAALREIDLRVNDMNRP